MISMDLKEIVETRLDQLGLSPIEAATRHGVERTFLRDILTGRKKSVRSDKMPLVAKLLDLDVAALSKGQLVPIDAATIDEPEPAGYDIPLMGYIGAGAEIEPEYEQVPPEGLDQITLPFPLPDDLIAFEVRGESMLPFYKNGFVIVAYREQKKPVSAFYGEEAIVRTSSGRRYIKTIERGFNGVNLRSFNAPLIENAHIEWIGEIFAVMPKLAVKHAAKVGGIQGRLKLGT